MLAEWSVELGADDPKLEIPWASEDGRLRFFDLKRQPELLLEIREACLYPELAEFLSWANSGESSLETAKSDAWSSHEIDVEEEVFGERSKFGSYVDLLFTPLDRRSRFAENEQFAQAIAKLLRGAPEMACSAEFIVRRCIDHRVKNETADGYYITFYLRGYGEDEPQARQRWAIALKMVQHAITQLGSARSGSQLSA